MSRCLTALVRGICNRAGNASQTARLDIPAAVRYDNGMATRLQDEMARQTTSEKQLPISARS
jgi:hypothetical protein